VLGKGHNNVLTYYSQADQKKTCLSPLFPWNSAGSADRSRKRMAVPITNIKEYKRGTKKVTALHVLFFK
jgi:hypothetical protein